MRKLGLDVLDLFLIHWPIPMFDLYGETWRAFVRLQQEGRVRSIGVSNFEAEHIERIASETGVMPAVNQIELHPEFPQEELRAFHAEHGILTESWGPLGQGKGLLENRHVVEVARAEVSNAGAGGVAMAPGAGQRRHSEIGDSGSDQREL